MSVRKLSISLSPELADALDALAGERGDDRSRLVEILLREHPLVARRIRRSRGAMPPTKRGRSLEELKLAGKVARAAWERRVASGEVEVRGRDA